METKPKSVVLTARQLPVGKAAHQGDLVLVRIAGVPVGSTVRDNLQLAEGSDQGSRHVLAHGRAFNAPGAAAAIEAATGVKVEPAYVGPVVEAVDGELVITHPEHADHEYYGPIVLAVVFQRVLDAEERAQRVRD